MTGRIAAFALLLLVAGCKPTPPPSRNVSVPIVTTPPAGVAAAVQMDATRQERDRLAKEVARLRVRLYRLELDAALDARYRAYLRAARLTDRIEHVPSSTP